MATDRLRRRLRDVDADEPSTLTARFCLVGTPLPDPSSHKQDQNELKPIWQQEARDAQGRRRFHGAFTGGFSAGYFNTVGSKEGWTPGSFCSSRGDKAAGKQAQQTGVSRPEDFMDEEDLEDWKRAQQVTASSAPQTLNLDDGIAGMRQAGGDSNHSSLGSVLEHLGSDGDDNLGYKLLRRMGWKNGQSLGPKVDARKKARLQGLIASGSNIATSSSVTSKDLNHLYVPPPTPLLTSFPTRSRRGLGAEDQPNLNEALAASIGASDSGAWTTAVRGSSTDVWPDGRPLPPGFRLAALPLPPEPEFPSDPVPNGWRPDPSRIGKRYGSALSTVIKQENLSTASRGQLLGEAKIPGPPPSIAAFLSEKARERLAADHSALLPASELPSTAQAVEVPRLDVATAKQALQSPAPFGMDDAKTERYREYLKSQIDASSGHAGPLSVPAHMTAEELSSELQEFVKSATIFRPMSAAIASRFTTASAAVIAHEAKVTSATPGLRHPAQESTSSSLRQIEDTNLNFTTPGEDLSMSQKAAQMGNFGHLTRAVEPWAPERLLCKRFGVPEPATSRQRRDVEKERPNTSGKAARPDSGDDEDAFYSSRRSSRKKSEIQVDQHWERNKEQLKALATGPTPLSLEVQSADNFPPATRIAEDDGESAEVGLGDDERQGKETLTYLKPSMDVFKAIFESDDESADDDHAIQTVQPKIQDPASGSGVVFQGRSKRKDTSGTERTVKPSSTGRGEKKRKKDQVSKTKSLLTFDLDEDEAQGSAPVAVPKARGKPRAKASDLF